MYPRPTPIAAPHRRTSRGFTLIELLVAIGIIAVIIAILIPAIGALRRHARTTTCLANLRHIGAAILNYAADHRGKIVPADLMPPDPYNKAQVRLGNWATILVSRGYLSAPDATADPAAGTGSPLDAFTNPVRISASIRSVFHCPEGPEINGFHNDAYSKADRTDPQRDGYWRRQETVLLPGKKTRPGITILTWYGINADAKSGKDFPTFRFPSDSGRKELHDLTELNNAGEVAMVYDGFFHHDGYGNLLGHARHNGGTVANYLLADGHAESVAITRLPRSLDPPDLAAAPDSFPKFKLHQ
jgi:prepilin-type N-terminal cleavage/methylation domain-containing protein/prepilin-type processing-associated H-X9-DG protein